jgi:hypothetical protein
MSFNPEVKEQRDELYRITYTIESFDEYVRSKKSIKDWKEYLQQKKIEQEELIYKLKNKI